MRRPVQRLGTQESLRLAGLLGAVLLIFVLGHQLRGSLSHWDYNGIRLQRSFVLAAGESIYADVDEGLVLSTIYGPIGAVAYLPATLMGGPSDALAAGLLLALLFVLLPAAALHATAVPVGYRVVGFLAFAAGVSDLRPLTYVATTIHVDAPALALGALAIVALTRPRSTHLSYGSAAAAATLAVWTKQVMAPLVVVLWLWVLWRRGRGEALRFALWLALLGGGLSLVVIWLFGPLDRILLNMFIVPAAHRLPGGAPLPALAAATRLVLAETASAWLLLLAGLALAWRSEPGAAMGLVDRAPAATLCGLAAAGLLPMSILGRIKLGGDTNASSYFAYFALLAATLTLARVAAEGRREEGGVGSLARLVLAGFLVLSLAVPTLLEGPEILSSWTRPLDPASLPHEVAFRFARRHPGEVYFPRLTMASYLAEGRLYHQSAGLFDRREAGLPVVGRHLEAYLPPRLRAIAFVRNGFESEIDEILLEGFDAVGSDPELPGFVVWRRSSE